MNMNVLPLPSIKTRVTLFTLAILVIGIWSLAFYAGRMLREDMQSLGATLEFGPGPGAVFAVSFTPTEPIALASPA